MFRLLNGALNCRKRIAQISRRTVGTVAAAQALSLRDSELVPQLLERPQQPVWTPSQWFAGTEDAWDGSASSGSLAPHAPTPCPLTRKWSFLASALAKAVKSERKVPRSSLLLFHIPPSPAVSKRIQLRPVIYYLKGYVAETVYKKSSLCAQPSVYF